MVDYMPTISIHAQSLFRVCYAVTLFLTFTRWAPTWKLFFTSQKWGGYVEPTPFTNRFHTVPILRVVIGLWFLTPFALFFGKFIIAAAAYNFVCCYYFFIRQRWKSLLRGMGAPGFISWWGGSALLILEYTSVYAPDLKSLGLLVIQVDFAVIMFTAGIYKLSAGYFTNDGQELGMVNPEWGYWWKALRKIKPNHWLFWVMNQLGWSGEVVGAALMLYPPTRIYGAAFIAVAFLYVDLIIRLGWLTEMVVTCTMLFIPAGHVVDLFIANHWPAFLLNSPQSVTSPLLDSFNFYLLAPFLWCYLFVRPVVIMGLWYNYYAGRRFPDPIQKSLEFLANSFGIILWRVFTKEVVNFYIRIERLKKDGSSLMVSHYDNRFDFRYNQVAESIAVTTIFTALKYYSTPEIFERRVKAYSKTVLKPYEDRGVRYTYMKLSKENNRFSDFPVFECFYAADDQSIEFNILDKKEFSTFSQNSWASQKCVRPGSYVSAAQVNT